MPGPRAPETTRRQQILDAAYRVALGDGLDGLTLRAVAASARLSHGLVVFHFKQKDQLISALLDRVLAETRVRQRRADAAPSLSPAERVSAVLHEEMDGLGRDPRWLRLFLEYWALGMRDPRLGKKISAALRQYRATFRVAAGNPAADTPGAPGTTGTADAFAAIAMSLVSGFAMQATVDPGHIDRTAYARIVDAIVAAMLAPPARPGRRVRRHQQRDTPRGQPRAL